MGETNGNGCPTVHWCIIGSKCFVKLLKMYGEQGVHVDLSYALLFKLIKID